MKKGLTFYLTLLMLLNFVYGEVANDAVKNIRKVRGIAGLFNQTQKIDQKLTTQQPEQRVKPPSQFRQEIMARNNKPERGILTKSDLVGNFKATHLEKSLAVYDTLKIIPGETNQITYTAGDVFVLWALAAEPLAVEFYLDDGDALFNPGLDRQIPFDGGAAPIITDGEEPDETPAGDGIIMFHVNTGLMDEGPGVFLGLQNAKVWIVATPVGSATPALGLANILPISENTSIAGSVLFPDKTPAPGQVVVAFPIDSTGSMDDPEAIFITITDNNGFFYLGIPDAMRGQYLVFVVDFWNLYPGYFVNPPFQEVWVFGPTYRVDFTMTGATATISGYVKTNDNVGVGNVEVIASLSGMEDMTRVVGTTDASGFYTLGVYPGEWHVEINPQSLGGNYIAPRSWDYLYVNEGQTVTKDFIIYPCDGYLSGWVRFNSGLPVEGAGVFAEIWKQDSYGNWLGYMTETRTDQWGNYLLRVSKALQGPSGMDTNFYYVGAWYEDAVIVPWGYNVLADAENLNFTVYRTDATFSGFIYDRQIQKPVSDAGVRAYSLNKNGTTFENWGYTDENGYFELDLVGGAPPGMMYAIEVYWPYTSYPPALYDTLLVVSGQSYSRSYYIGPPERIAYVNGYVRDVWGNNLSGALVEFNQQDVKSSYFTYTDSYGYYQLENLPVGWYWAKASYPGYQASEGSFWLNDGNNWVEFYLNREQIKLSGIVKDAVTGTGLPNSHVYLSYPGGEWIQGVFTDDLGYYEFSVDPGVYQLVAGRNGYYRVTIDSLIVNESLSLDLALNQAVIAGNIAGHVFDNNNVPINNAWVFVESDNYLAWGFTNNQGWYEIPLVEGFYQAYIGADGYHEEHRSFQFPGGGLEEPILLFRSDYISGPKLISVLDVPADQGKQVRLTWLPDPNLYGWVKEYQIYRAIQRFDGPDPRPYQPISWDYIATVPFRQGCSEYNFVAPTLYDKVGDDIYWTGFMVSAVTWDNWNYYDSNVKAGWSEDNLAPEVPKSLAGDRVDGQITLKWEEVTSEEVKYYTVYRKVGTGDFARLAHTTKPEYVDVDVTTSGTYAYCVTATDFGLNESEKSAPLVLAAVSLADERRIPDKYSLAQNYPNPFNPATRIEFGLPKSDRVSLTIYNLMGQIVREYHLQLPAGYAHVVWDGCDNYGNQVGSGVYIYTLATGEFKQTRKMILMR